MLAYCVELHMRDSLRPLLFCDEYPEAKTIRGPVARADRLPAGMDKDHNKTLDYGSRAQSLQSLFQLLSGIVLNMPRFRGPSTWLRRKLSIR